ncbi:MAG: phosphatidate cytidylyltransferase [Proteobacteria bacterium]|nr:phosphatidate cytidylyltransferase [Pseudomonadota bacterium]
MQVVNDGTDSPAISSELHEMLKQRVVTAVVALSVLAVVMFVVPAIVARIAITLLMLGAAWEWSGFIFSKDDKGRYVHVLSIAILMAVIFVELPDAALVNVILKISLGWWLTALVWMFFFPTPIAKPVAWICGALVIVPAWLALDLLYVQRPELLLFALLIVWLADIGAYFVGKGFGRVKLAPQISPGKTWEGVLGGVGAVMALAATGSHVFEIEIVVMVPFCLAVAMISIVGDLTVSMFKRHAGVKDSGSLFPGHGGLLDRIDSVTAAAPLFAYALSWTGMQ